MVEINRENKTITFRVLFAGPPGAGKRTTFHSIHSQVSPTIRTEIVDINEGVGKLLSFDLIPLALGRSDFNSRLRLQTTCEVDGCANLLKELSPVFDGIIFIADSDPEKAQLNLEVLNYLEGVPFLSKIPLLLQFNKRDLLDAVSVEKMALEFLELFNVGRQIKFLLEPVVVDRALADDLILGGSPGARFAFTNSCVTANCAQWTGARCKAISSALSVYADANQSGAQVEQCFLLNSCRWRAQEGESACGVCPLVINDSQLHVGFNGKEIIVSTPDL